MNFGTPVPLLVGIVLILVAVGLFFLDKFKPGYKRDSDTVYSILFLTVGILSLFQLNQEFLPSFQLMIFAGMLIALMLDSIRRRTPGGANSLRPEPAARSEYGSRSEPSRPTREPKPSDRSSRYDNYDYQEPVYRSEIQAEFDDGPVVMEQRSNQRQIRGSRETRDNRRASRDYPEPDNARDSRDDYRRDNRSLEPANYFDDYSDSPQDARESRRPSRQNRSDRGGDDSEQTETNRRSSKRRGPSLESDEPSYGTGHYSDSGYSDGSPDNRDRLNPDESPELLGKGHRKSRAGSPSGGSPVNHDQTISNGAPRRRPKPKLNLDEDDAPVGGGDYVDYQPLDKPLKRSEGSTSSTPPVSGPATDTSSGFAGGLEENGSSAEPMRSRRRRRSENLGGSGLGSLSDPLDLGNPDDEF